MKQLRKTTRVLATIVTALILLSSLQGIVSAQSELDPIVILYDESHDQQYASDDETGGLKLMLDMVNASTKYNLRINEDDELTDTVLNDVDILIIAAPDENSPFTENEANGISEFLANGSSLFVLGDPTIGENSRYWAEALMQDMGENEAINSFLDVINVTSVRFSLNESRFDEVYSDVMFDEDNAVFNATYSWVIRLDSSTWDTSHPIFRNINEIYAMTATLKPIELASGIARGYESSFAQFKLDFNSWANYSFPNMTLADFEQDPLSFSTINGTYPSWMSAFEYNTSRIVIAGSTLMFTGRDLDHPDTDLRWFYMGDNARLFMNIMEWLSEDFISAPSAITPLVIISSVVLVVGVVFYLFKKLR
ncbi:MAG: Gldg family protein [Candidatus Thorarchaeota archaeon]|jgi:hypothetical protein